MIAEIGHFTLVLAFFLCLFFAYNWIRVLQGGTGHAALLQLSSTSLDWIFLCIFISWLCLVWGFVLLDFSMAYVAQNAHSTMPWYYRVPASWGAHEGSMMLWLTMLVFWWRQSQSARQTMNGQSYAWLMVLFALFVALIVGFIWLTSNPFTRLLPIPAIEGRDLNPLLQDWGLISHPPLLYVGYIGLCLPFFVFVAVSLGQQDDLRRCAEWMSGHLHLAWSALTTGIVLGSWWAYRELGWGGWWFWDPVENVSLMPWLILTALLHANLRLKRGEGIQLAGWLCLFGFLLSMMGTFLVRSGLLVSVHSFAQDPMRGAYLLVVLIAMAILVFCATWRTRWSDRSTQSGVRDWLLISQQILFLAIVAIVALGTLYPLILQVMALDRISIGPPYYEKTLLPLVVLISVMLGLYAYRGFGIVKIQTLTVRFVWVALITLLISWYAVLWASPLAILSIAMAVWILQAQLMQSLSSASVAHIGLAVMIVGVGLSQWQSLTSETIWTVGESRTLSNHKITLMDVRPIRQDNYHGVRGSVHVEHNGSHVKLYPELRLFDTQNMALAKVSIWPRMWGDVYIAMGDQTGQQEWVMRIYTKPFIRWIWLGGLMMAAAGLWQWLRKFNLTS